MPIEIVRQDISDVAADAVVTPIYPKKSWKRFHARAGSAFARETGRKLDICTVCPISGESRQQELLRRCYLESLKLAKRHRCWVAAIPLLAEEDEGLSAGAAMRIAMDSIREFLAREDLHIMLVVQNRNAFGISQLLRRDVSEYLRRNLQEDRQAEQQKISYGGFMENDDREKWGPLPPSPAQAPMPASKAKRPKPLQPQPRRVQSETGALPELKELLSRTDAGFSETLLSHIDRSGKKDSEIYTKANVSRQHFSKIRNNPDYKPTKPTAIAFAIALELDLDQTRDLIGRAGYALTGSSKFDVIIMFFIQRKNYNLFDINAALYEFDQSLLGA